MRATPPWPLDPVFGLSALELIIWRRLWQLPVAHRWVGCELALGACVKGWVRALSTRDPALLAEKRADERQFFITRRMAVSVERAVHPFIPEIGG